jgi:hypothetical protein
MKSLHIAMVGFSIGGFSIGLGAPSALAAQPASALTKERHTAAQLAKGKTPGWQKDLTKMRAAAESGRAGFADVFSRDKLLRGIAQGREQQLGFDQEAGARSAADARSKFVIIRDFSAQGSVLKNFHTEHVLAVATPAGKQPISIFDVEPHKVEHLGRMMRAVLRSDQVQAKRGQFKSWYAHVSLPDKISIPYLHIHGEEQIGAAYTPTLESKTIRDWPRFLKENGYTAVGAPRNGFQLFAGKAGNSPSGWEVVAVADAATSPRQLDAKSDELLGRMIVEVGQAAVDKSRGVTAGHVEVARDDSRLVVRAVNYQSHAFDAERAELERQARAMTPISVEDFKLAK